MRIPLLFALLAPLTLSAQTTAPEPPAMPDQEPPAAEPQELEQGVTIRTEGETRIEEYRANGRLFMVKITPANGAPYYIIDNDGDGRLETYTTDLDNPNIAQWTLFRW